MSALIEKAKSAIGLAKKYWHEPPKGNYVSYKEVAFLSGAGFGVYWATLLPSAIGLNAANFLVGACIGLKPMDLQVMLIVANLIGIPLGIFRSWYYDNHNLKGGKFLPFIKLSVVPMVLISTIFVWLPYEQFSYVTKVIVVECMYLLLNVFLSFYNEGYTYFQQIVTPNAQERTTVMSISQVVYSLAPTITNLFVPLIAGLTWGLNNIWTYRIIFPVFTVIGMVISIIFFSKVKERLVLPKKRLEPVRMLDAIREVAKNKYYWIIQAAGWVGFLENGYGVILSWSFVYAFDGKYEASLGLANTIIGNAALWSMLSAPLVIKIMGKRNLLITANAINIFVILSLYFVFDNLILVCVVLYINNFVNTFWNIVQHNISADMRDYHQWKTGVRVDGLFGPLGMIGTFIGFFTGMFYPAIYQRMGLLDDYNVLYDDNMRNGLFEVLIVFSALGAFLNLVPFFFYNLTENKHRAYVDVLKIRAMFENYSLGALEDDELKETMEIILQAKELYGKTPLSKDKTALKQARRMSKKTSEEKELRNKAIKKAKRLFAEVKETNLAIERATIIMQDLEKFTTESGIKALEQAKQDVMKGNAFVYDDAKNLLKIAKKLPKKTAAEKEIREAAIKNARTKRVAFSLVQKCGAENIVVPNEKVKEAILNRKTESFAESVGQRRALRKYLKNESIYLRATKPFRDAESLIKQAENYTHYEDLVDRYKDLVEI